MSNISSDNLFAKQVAQNKFKRSSKMSKLFEKLKPIMNNSDDKVVIFSHFLGFIELLKFEFSNEGIGVLVFDGSLTKNRRAEIISQFTNSAENRILIVSIKTGGVGLNLTVANHVFLMEPWWNPAFEHQAIDRVYRIGQKKEVQIVRFICTDTVETRIHFIQEEKMELASNTLTAGSIEKREENIANIRKVFQ